MTDTPVDELERRCPRLGNPITFEYCLISGEDEMPCWKIRDCWWEIFDVESYLRANLPEAVFNRLVTAKPGNKVSSILELVEKAKQRTGK